MKNLLALTLLIACPGQSSEFLLAPDTATKAAAGAGLTFSSGAASIFYNPANLNKHEGHELDAEISPGRIDYQFNSATEKASGGIDLLAPPVFLGGTWQTPFGVKVAGALIPKGPQTNTIDKLPITVIGSELLVKAVITDSSYRYGLGAGFSPIPNLQIGAATIVDVDNQKTEIFGEAKDPATTISSFGIFNRYVFGCNYSLNPRWTLATAYSSAMIKKYQGTIRMFHGLGQGPNSAASYLPSEAKLGLQLQLEGLTLAIEYNYLGYTSGRYSRRTGLGTQAEEAKDFSNTHNFRIAGSYHSAAQTYIGGLAWLPSSIGNGRFKPQTSPSDPLVAETLGIPMSADFDYVNRYVFSAGLLHQLTQKVQMGFAFSYLYGFKEIPLSAPNAGLYRLNIIQLGFGTQYSLYRQPD